MLDETTMDNFRVMPFAITFQRKEHSTDPDLFYGDEKSVRYRLFRSFQQNFNIFTPSQLHRSKFDFGRKLIERKFFQKGTSKFEDGNLGSGSRLVLMVMKLADLVQPTLSLTHLATHNDYHRTFYKDEDAEKDTSNLLIFNIFWGFEHIINIRFIFYLYYLKNCKIKIG